MESLQDILGSRDFSPPDELTAVKEYIKRRYNSDCSVQLQRDALLLRVPNSSLASTVRLEQNKLIEACNLKHKLVIRYGTR
jgi:hypothetical protein